MEIREEKNRYREIVRLEKRKHSFEEKKELSKAILERLESLDCFKEAKTIMFYWSMKDEVHTHDFILSWYRHKKILLPCVEGDVLVIREFTGMDSMKEGEAFSILEPIGEVFEDLDNIDLILVPGVAYDKDKNRLGRGGGYYDKLLSETKAVKIGIGFDFQKFENIPVESFDIKMDIIL